MRTPAAHIVVNTMNQLMHGLEWACIHANYRVRFSFVCNDGPLFRLAEVLFQLVASADTQPGRFSMARVRCRRVLKVGPLTVHGRIFRKLIEAGVAAQLVTRGRQDVLLAGGERWPFAYVRGARRFVRTIDLEDGLRTLLDVGELGAENREFFGALFALDSYAHNGVSHRYQNLSTRLADKTALDSYCQHAAFDADVWVFGTPMSMVYEMPSASESALYQVLAEALMAQYPGRTVAFFPHGRQVINCAELEQQTGWQVCESSLPKELAVLACGKCPEAIVGFYSTLTLYMPLIQPEICSHAVFVSARSAERRQVVSEVNRHIETGLCDLGQTGPHWLVDDHGQLSQIESLTRSQASRQPLEAGDAWQ